MPLKLDTVDGAEGEVRKGLKRVVRGAVITDMDVSVPAEVIPRAMTYPGLPNMGSSLSSSYPTYRLARIIPRAARGKIVFLRLVYEDESTPGGGGGPVFETFSVEDVTTLASGSTQLLPGDLTPLRVSLTGTDTEADLAAGETATMSYPVPMRSLVLYGLFATRPSVSLLHAMRYVNGATWMGLPKGYWLLSGVSVRYSNVQEGFAVTCTTTTKTEEDWSSYNSVRGPDNKHIRVPEAETTMLRNQTYEYGIRYKKYGLLKAGPFRLQNFSALFGIG